MAATSAWSALRSRLARARAADPAAFRARAVLGSVLFVLVLRLVFGDDPFTSGIAERTAEGKPLRPVDYARTFGWWAALANAVLAVGLLATLRLWLRRGATPEVAELAPPAGGVPRPLALALLAAVVACGVLAWPRLPASLWGDETFAVRHAIRGEYRVEDGTVEFHQPRWRDTFYEYEKPYNHVPFSILSRLTEGTWRALARPQTEFAVEPALRLPAFAAGLGAVAVTGLALWRLGFPWAAALAAWLMALHPWVVRYASEARGYAQLLLLVPACVWLLVRALHRGGWGRWLALGAAEMLLLWTNPGALHFLVLANLAAFVALLRLHRGTPALAQQLGRFGVANVAAAMAFVQVMLPNLAQLRVYLTERDPATPDLRLFVPELLSHLWAGMRWGSTPSNPIFPDLAGLLDLYPLAAGTAAALATLGVALGALRLLRAGGFRALLAGVLLLAAPVSVFFAWLNDYYLYVWYLIFALPGLVMLLALGLTWPLPRLGAATAVGLQLALLATYLADYAWLTSGELRNLRERPLWPIRDSILAVRPTLDPRDPRNAGILTASFEGTPPYYDPWLRKLETVDELRALVDEADATGRPLFLNLGPPRYGASAEPELRSWFETSGLFEEVAVLYGLEPKATRHVYRYAGRTGAR